jgi:MraZ protein
VRDYSRVFFASASHEIPDGQGRITVPPALREYAGLTKDCVVIGANTRVEVWDAVGWGEYLDRTEQAFADAEEVVIPGLL